MIAFNAQTVSMNTLQLLSRKITSVSKIIENYKQLFTTSFINTITTIKSA